MKLVVTETINNVVEVEKLETILEIADFDAGLRQMLEAEQSNTTTATGDIALTDSDKVIQIIDPGGATRVITLPAESVDNHGFLVFNVADADGELLTVKDDAGTTLATLYRNGAGWFISNGLEWKSVGIGTSSQVGQPIKNCEGRLTLETGVPVSTADQSAKATLYFTPYKGNTIAIYNVASTEWDYHEFTEKSLSLAALNNATNYDIFIYDNSGTLTLEAVAWTNGTTRATALTTQDGVLVSSANAGKRYLGTIRTSAAGKTSDTTGKRFVWNYYNRATKILFADDATVSWSYNNSAWRAYNNSQANRVEVVVGVNEEPVEAIFTASAKASSAGYTNVGIALDSVSGIDPTKCSITVISNIESTTIIAHFLAYIGIGYHYLQMMERVRTGYTSVFYNNQTGEAEYHSNLRGVIRG